MDPSRSEPSSTFQEQGDSKHRKHGKGTFGFKFNAEETRALRECNSESFYYRSVPIGTALGFAGHFGVKLGYLKPSARYGTMVKVMTGTVIGYFIGKLSYQRRCEEKIMKLENSPLADALRRRRGISTDSGFASSGADSYTYQPSSPTDSSAMTSSLDLDSDLNTQSQGLDDSQRPSMDSPERVQISTEEPVRQTYTNYQDLRQSNRDQYEIRRLQKTLRRQEKASAQSPQGYQSPEASNKSSVVQTKYGDVWEEDASP